MVKLEKGKKLQIINFHCYEKDKNNSVFNVVRYIEFFNFRIISDRNETTPRQPKSLNMLIKRTMKSLKIILAVLSLTLFSVQGGFAQTEPQTEKEVLETTKEKTPQKVKESLKDYSNSCQEKGH